MQPVAPPLVTPPIRKAIHRHAAEVYPHEACGLIVSGEYVPCENIHETPEEAFRIDARLVAVACDEHPGEVAIVHSHPNGPAAPTGADMVGQARTGVPWVIAVMTSQGSVIADFEFPVSLDEPLEGLGFRQGVRDCYTHIRKWYWQNRGVELLEFPRDPTWWEKGATLYLDGFEKAGFRKLTREESYIDGKLTLEVGDVGLWSFMTQKTINHGAVYTGGKLLTHHLPNRLGRSEPVERWASRIQLWLRYCPDEHNSPPRPLGGEIRQDV